MTEPPTDMAQVIKLLGRKNDGDIAFRAQFKDQIVSFYAESLILARIVAVMHFQPRRNEHALVKVKAIGERAA